MPIPPRPSCDALPPSSHTASADSLGRVLFTRLVNQGRLRHLHLLVELEDCGSILRAAARLPMSQSAATQALAELERILGLALLERHARGSRLTAAGRALAQSARGALSGLRQAAESLAALQQGCAAVLRLGTIPAAAYALMSPLLAPFYETHPHVHLELLEDRGERLLPMLIDGSLDAVFCRAPERLPEDCLFEALLEDDIVVAAGIGHALAQARQVPLRELADLCWVLPAMNIQLRRLFEDLLLSEYPDTRWFPVNTLSLPVLEGLLQQPQAVAMLPRSIVRGLQSSGRVTLLDVQLKAAMAPLGVAYRPRQAPALLERLLAPARRARGTP